ncbi:MAG: DeoR/GlpR transcriptional regulator [Paenibacillus sp.]|nr:DeoR/GlpR transcriptional regulator [Paenibacillus sp.]
MLYEEERQQKITDYVQSRERASVQELAQQFQVSESTVRRDLKILMEKEDRYRIQKEAIAKAAAALVQEGDTIVLDSGTTTYYLAKELKSFKQLTVVTNSVMVAQELLTHKGIELVLTGGTLRHESLAMVGPLTENAMESVYVNKAFVATNSMDPIIGLTTPNMLEASAKRSMFRSAKQVILLADHSKYGRVSFAKVAELSDIDHCVTDDRISEKALKELEAAGISVTVVKVGGEKP